MIGIFIIAIASFFGEIADSIGKFEVKHKKEGLYALVFLNLVPATLVFAAIAFIDQSQFVFSAASLPTFIARSGLEILQAHVTVRALVTADRSTFSFMRLGTIPLLIISDVALGYTLNRPQWIGMGIILLSLIGLFVGKEISRRGLGLIFFSAVNGAVVLTLYKYNITNYNSVAAEQGLIYIILLLYFLGTALRRERAHLWSYFHNRTVLAQSAAVGVTAVLISYAYLISAASVITTASRSLSVFWSIIFGRKYFAEKHILAKIGALLVIVAGLFLLGQ